ncbi:uncharacterized protein LOC142974666 [Anticarsia gemmatalis]|uniref:uncharacterized protein LOC142974666 n=1 Tax=Anticarsia gemmatalis TaxID=129554 RepID=UPI003F75E829
MNIFGFVIAISGITLLQCSLHLCNNIEENDEDAIDNVTDAEQNAQLTNNDGSKESKIRKHKHKHNDDSKPEPLLIQIKPDYLLFVPNVKDLYSNEMNIQISSKHKKRTSKKRRKNQKRKLKKTPSKGKNIKLSKKAATKNSTKVPKLKTSTEKETTIKQTSAPLTTAKVSIPLHKTLLKVVATYDSTIKAVTTHPSNFRSQSNTSSDQTPVADTTLKPSSVSPKTIANDTVKELLPDETTDNKTKLLRTMDLNSTHKLSELPTIEKNIERYANESIKNATLKLSSPKETITEATLQNIIRSNVQPTNSTMVKDIPTNMTKLEDKDEKPATVSQENDVDETTTAKVTRRNEDTIVINPSRTIAVYILTEKSTENLHTTESIPIKEATTKAIDAINSTKVTVGNKSQPVETPTSITAENITTPMPTENIPILVKTSQETTLPPGILRSIKVNSNLTEPSDDLFQKAEMISLNNVTANHTKLLSMVEPVTKKNEETASNLEKEVEEKAVDISKASKIVQEQTVMPKTARMMDSTPQGEATTEQDSSDWEKRIAMLERQIMELRSSKIH